MYFGNNNITNNTSQDIKYGNFYGNGNENYSININFEYKIFIIVCSCVDKGYDNYESVVYFFTPDLSNFREIIQSIPINLSINSWTNIYFSVRQQQNNIIINTRKSDVYVLQGNWVAW